jgi:hypothetical protein
MMLKHWTVVAAALLVGGAVQAADKPASHSARGTMVSPDAIANSPSLYRGKLVTVRAEVERVYGPQLFAVAEDRAGANREVLVLMPRSPQQPVQNGGAVVVAGTVRDFVDADVFWDYGWFDAEPEMVATLRSRPVIVARSVSTGDGVALLTPSRHGASAGMQTGSASGSTMAPLTVMPGELAANPTSYLGRTVTVRSEVENVVNPHVFTLDEDRMGAGPDVLVLNPRPTIAATDDQMVTVTGTVRSYVEAEIERDYDWFDATPELEVRFQGRPVIVADSIRTQNGREIVASATR